MDQGLSGQCSGIIASKCVVIPFCASARYRTGPERMAGGQKLPEVQAARSLGRSEPSVSDVSASSAGAYARRRAKGGGKGRLGTFGSRTSRVRGVCFSFGFRESRTARVSVRVRAFWEERIQGSLKVCPLSTLDCAHTSFVTSSSCVANSNGTPTHGHQGLQCDAAVLHLPAGTPRTAPALPPWRRGTASSRASTGAPATPARSGLHLRGRFPS